MKKLLALLSFIGLAVACATPPANREAAPSPGASRAPEPIARVSNEDAATKEKAAWDAIQKKDFAAFGDMLTNDYIEVNSEAVYDKAGSLEAVKQLALTEVTFSDWKTIPIDNDAFVVTYTVNVKGSYKGKDFPPTAVRGSSAWVSRNGKWLAIYHQETDVKKGPPPPPPAAGKSKASASPSPSAMPTQASTGPDAEANEKIVWDALKRKDFDAFAALLAPEATEVEPDAVSDKAGSVKGVSQFDFSKASLSDFKTVKFDNDASLVTYMVKIPGMTPDSERHSTIWVNRSGKWLALFHQGTPLMKAPATAPAAKSTPTMKM